VREDFILKALTDERGTRVAPYCRLCDEEVQASPYEVFEALSLADLIALADHHDLKVHSEGEG